MERGKRKYCWVLKYAAIYKKYHTEEIEQTQASKQMPRPCSLVPTPGSLGNGTITLHKTATDISGLRGLLPHGHDTQQLPFRGHIPKKPNSESAGRGGPMDVCTNADGQALTNYPTSRSTLLSSILTNHFFLLFVWL